MSPAASASDENPAATDTVKAAPNAAQNHTVQVKLNAEGEWSQVQSSTVKMRIAYTHQWSQKPTKHVYARIYLGHAKIPGNNNGACSTSTTCTGRPVQSVLPTQPEPPKPAAPGNLQAAPPPPPKPGIKLQAAPVEPAKPAAIRQAP